MLTMLVCLMQAAYGGYSDNSGEATMRYLSGFVKIGQAIKKTCPLLPELLFQFDAPKKG
jgi:hypothetical protein